MISIVIVNHNTGNVLGDCIDSLFTFENPSNFEVIIVDNNSSDKPHSYIDILCGKYRNVKCIYLDLSESFSSANNQGIRMASGEYILIMNPDIIYIEPVLDKLLSVLIKEKDIGVICPALLGVDGRFQHNYFQRYPGLFQYLLFYTFTAKLFERNKQLTNRFLRNEIIDISTKHNYEVGQVPCAFFLTKRSILDEMGMLDENFELFFEDVDLSYRIHKKYLLVVDTSARVKHIGAASFGKDYDILMYGRFLISMNYFFKKHYGWFRQFSLKMFSKMNSYTVIIIEYIKKMMGKPNNTRLLKHKKYIELLKEV